MFHTISTVIEPTDITPSSSHIWYGPCWIYIIYSCVFITVHEKCCGFHGSRDCPRLGPWADIWTLNFDGEVKDISITAIWRILRAARVRP
ncbi:hypothetical protein BDR05DRAFT_752832 [Suillus weaverae]|nr:hypothetical protein BDR05DRAFT_752832 [Suillus weaverae]